MRLIFVLFDALNRLALQGYGGDIETRGAKRDSMAASSAT
ncbi:hypothetical protein SAMN04488245_105108 [Alloyangia pacifica]|uniref:Uncharacterized protein n=1 Tax=Alloyangia pacifica TaxID=311180 RepID=A0A1I6SWT3_9RHOB|nr:hypothetical protein SAMN04488245_105108 [Alloyangia pacifica]SFS81332.1 hypothetical protein SAMN04488050_105108 [Alloyangia pacifica]